jgi:hypothetical protein
MAELHARSADRTFQASPIEAELRATATTNAEAHKRVARRAAMRARLEYLVAALLLAVALGWLADNVIGYATSARVETKKAPTAQIDCWAAGSRATVWRAAAPAGALLPKRCGDTALTVAIPGMVSAGVIAVGLLAGLLMWRVARRRWRANWY